jgi:hypothetical protein
MGARWGFAAFRLLFVSVLHGTRVKEQTSQRGRACEAHPTCHHASASTHTVQANTSARHVISASFFRHFFSRARPPASVRQLRLVRRARTDQDHEHRRKHGRWREVACLPAPRWPHLRQVSSFAGQVVWRGAMVRPKSEMGVARASTRMGADTQALDVRRQPPA